MDLTSVNKGTFPGQSEGAGSINMIRNIAIKLGDFDGVARARRAHSLTQQLQGECAPTHSLLYNRDSYTLGVWTSWMPPRQSPGVCLPAAPAKGCILVGLSLNAVQQRRRSVATTTRQIRAMTSQELPCTSAANNRLARTNKKRTHQDPDEHDASQSRQIQGNANKTGRSAPVLPRTT